MLTIRRVGTIACICFLSGCSEFDVTSLYGQDRGPTKEPKTHHDDEYHVRRSPDNYSGRQHSYAGPDRLEDKIDGIRRIQMQLQAEHALFTVHLNALQGRVGSSSLSILKEYGDFLKSMEELARMREKFPTIAVWIGMDAMRVGGDNRNLIQPFPLPPDGGKSVITPKSDTIDPVVANTSHHVDVIASRSNELIDYTANLRKFIEFCISRAAGAEQEVLRSLGASMLNRNESQFDRDTLAGIVEKVNSVISSLNIAIQGLPSRESMSLDVWIDSSQVQDRKDKKKLNRLFFEERKKRQHSSTPLVPLQGDIPSLYSLTVHRHSRHNRLRVFRNIQLHKVKIVGICEAGKDPYMFSFECDDSSRSILLLVDSRRQNKVADAVLKVTCHAKAFAKRLVDDPLARADRCFLSKWSGIAATESIEPQLGLTDRKAKRAFHQLKNGDGCFAKEELDIDIDCL